MKSVLVSRELEQAHAPPPAGILQPVVIAALVNKYTPPEARATKALSVVQAKSASVLSAQVKQPRLFDFARRPAAKL